MTVVLFVLLSARAGIAQESVKAFYIGHSLTSDIPDMVRALATDADCTFTFKEQFIPGAPLRWQWEKPKSGEPQFQAMYDQELPRGGYDALVVTDSVPRGGKELEAETTDFLGRFYDLARKHNRGIRVYYYETWHHITSGTPQASEHDKLSPTRDLRWRPRLDADWEMWQRIVDGVNQKHAKGKDKVAMIPAGQALAAFVDQIAKKPVPGFKRGEDLFDDDIHLNPYGKYLVACVHYAVLFERSPEGLTHDVNDRWGRSYWNTPNWQNKQWPPPEPAAVKLMQKVAWDTVKKHAGR